MDMQQPQYPPPDSPPPQFTPEYGLPQKDNKALAIAALVLGILNLCAWFFPICGFPLGIAGVICGVLGLKSSSKTLAIVGLVLSGLALLLTLCNAIAGATLGLTDPNFFNNIINSI